MRFVLATSTRWLRLGILLIGVLAVTLDALGQSAASSMPGRRVTRTYKAAHEQAPSYRVQGKVSVIDPVAKTFTLSKKLVAVVPQTVLIKNGASSSFASIALGDEVDGIATMVSGKFTATSVRFGPPRKDLPYGIPVKDHPGYVTSPYSPKAGQIDVTGMPAGIEAKDPYSGKIFLVPR